MRQTARISERFASWRRHASSHSPDAAAPNERYAPTHLVRVRLLSARLLLVVAHLAAIHLLLVRAAAKLSRLERLPRLGVLLAHDGEEILRELDRLVDVPLLGAAAR